MNLIYDKEKCSRALVGSTRIYYEIQDDIIVIHSVVGELDSAIEWAESQDKQVAFIGRKGWAKALQQRPGWNTEIVCLGVFNDNGEHTSSKERAVLIDKEITNE